MEPLAFSHIDVLCLSSKNSQKQLSKNCIQIFSKQPIIISKESQLLLLLFISDGISKIIGLQCIAN